MLLGSFPDEYTTHVVDVVAMPQRGTGVSVEAIHHVFQTDMLLSKLNGRYSSSFTLIKPTKFVAVRVVVYSIASL